MQIISFSQKKTCLTNHVRFRPRDFESILVNRLHISWRTRGVQWASQQCLGSFHNFFGTELPKSFLCHTLFFFLASFPLLTTEFGLGWYCRLPRFTWKTKLFLLPFLPFLPATFRRRLHEVNGPEGHFFTKSPGELEICFKSSNEILAVSQGER